MHTSAPPSPLTLPPRRAGRPRPVAEQETNDWGLASVNQTPAGPTAHFKDVLRKAADAKAHGMGAENSCWTGARDV